MKSGKVAILSFVFLIVSLPAISYGQVPSECGQKIDQQVKKLDLPDWKKEGFKQLPEMTQELLKGIDTDRISIALNRGCVNILKKEESLADNQLRWLVQIEDLFVEADKAYSLARSYLILSEVFKEVLRKEPANERAKIDKDLTSQKAVDSLAEASKKKDKATRDLETLKTRVEIQKQRTK